MRRIGAIAGACVLVAALTSGQAVRADNGRPFDKVSFFFAAHEDDWQLFMNPTAFMDVTGGNSKAVFVHVTAGDAGLGVGRGGRKFPYYLARENGAEAAIRFMADSDQPSEKTTSHMTFNGHPVYRIAYRNTVSYFLRVPDGNPSGSGYPATGFQSLKLLATARNDTLAAIDGSTVYRGWPDFVASIRAIVDFERRDAPFVQINVAEPDQAINPGDHSDHLMTARAALDATKALSCVRKVYYIDYASAELPENLDVRERDVTSAVFAVTAAGIRALDHGNHWRRYDQNYVGKSYFRVDEGSGPCVDGREASQAGQTMADRRVDAGPTEP